MILKLAVNQGSFQGGKCLIQKSVWGRAAQPPSETISLAGTRVQGSGHSKCSWAQEQQCPQAAGGQRSQSPLIPNHQEAKQTLNDMAMSLNSLTKELLLPISRMKEKQKTFFSSLAVITGNFQTPDKLFLSSHTILGKSRVCPPCVRDDEKWITCYNCSYGSGKIQYCCMVCTPTVHGTSQC